MAQITAVTPVARAVGANRIVKGRAIVHPTGDVDLPPAEEMELRQEIVREALGTLQTE